MYKVGDKVIPHQKTRGVGMEKDSSWKRAQAKGQPFLYVARIRTDDDNNVRYLELADDMQYGNGNHWNLDDVMPFDFNEDDLLKMFIQGKISESAYNAFLKEHKNITEDTQSKVKQEDIGSSHKLKTEWEQLLEQLKVE